MSPELLTNSRGVDYARRRAVCLGAIGIIGIVGMFVWAAGRNHQVTTLAQEFEHIRWDMLRLSTRVIAFEPMVAQLQDDRANENLQAAVQQLEELVAQHNQGWDHYESRRHNQATDALQQAKAALGMADFYLMLVERDIARRHFL